MFTFLALIYIARASSKANGKTHDTVKVALVYFHRSVRPLVLAAQTAVELVQGRPPVQIYQRLRFPISFVTVIPKSIYKSR